MLYYININPFIANKNPSPQGTSLAALSSSPAVSGLPFVNGTSK
jgi:formiminotetrahydrofolate cyclodeaminase